MFYCYYVIIFYLFFILWFELNVIDFVFVNLDEFKFNIESVSFEVFCDKGIFGVVFVFWNIIVDNGVNLFLEVFLVFGVVNFLVRDSFKFIIIYLLLDIVSF